MKLERSIDRLAKKLDRLYPGFSSSNKTGLNYWKDKPIIPLKEWIKFRDTPYALDCFPDDFNQSFTYLSEDDLEKGRERKDMEKWNSDYLELMEYNKNPNYGKLKCFHCLLSPAGDDPIFIGINRLVAKGMNNDILKGNWIQYPCRVVNRFQCPYERTNFNADNNIKTTNPHFNIEDFFRLERMAFAVEIAFAKARKEDSKITVRNKEELFHALTEKETFTKMLEQGTGAPEVGEHIRTYLAENHDYILDYFMTIKDKVNMEELRFY